MTTSTTRGFRWLVVTQILSILAIIGLAFFAFPTSQTTQYPLLAKRLFLDQPNDVIINFTELRTQLQKYQGQSETVGIFFQYLPTGVSINIDGNTDFYRASLVKLPVVMRAYKFVEQGKLSLDDVLTVEAKQLNKDFGSLWEKGVGTKLTVRELIQKILQDSDNTAFNVLYEKVNVQLLNDLPSGDQSADDIYDYLDIPRQAEGITPMVTPRNYSSILSSLFFSAYLSYEHSNTILDTLSGPHPEKWMRQPIPDTIKVADKIGAYTSSPDNLHVFSDCGIVYYPQRPYVLCTMIHSDDEQKSVETIRNISKTVYEFISK